MGKQFRQGEKVAIINRSYNGKFILEGTATVLRRCDSDWSQDQYQVQFSDGSVATRFIDPAAQDDPEAFVAMLNRYSAERRNAETARETVEREGTHEADEDAAIQDECDRARD